MALLSKNIQRRDFLKGGVAAAAVVAAASAFGCSAKKEEKKATDDGVVPHEVASDAAILGEKGEWHTMFCSENCGGRCVNLGYLVDGLIVRQKTDDASDIEWQKRSCPRGRSLRQQVYNADRIKYPMKRKSWQPGGGENSHGELRGKDEWERISWDDALELVATELKRVYEAYGPRAVIANGWRWETGVNFLKAAGGCITNADVESYGTWGFLPALFGMNMEYGDHPDVKRINDRSDLVNADYIVLYGANPAWAQGNYPNYYLKKAQEAGVQFVSVGSSRNVSAALYDARWIRLRPGTDTAFLLAVMYEMIRLDEESGSIIDWDFLNNYTVGFDSDHMPEDAALDECISGYVKGQYDGVPKTPEWASDICGTPVEDITWYAQMESKQNKVMNLHSYVSSRANGSENLPQAFLTVAAMGGHFGKSGQATGSIFLDFGDSGPFLFKSEGGRANPAITNPIDDNCNIEGPAWWRALSEGKYLSTAKGAHTVDFGGAGQGASVYYEPAKEMTVNPRIFFETGKSNFLQSRQNLNGGIKVMRQADMCVAVDFKSTLTVQFSDIILPAATVLEFNNDESDGPLDWPRTFFYMNRRDFLPATMPLIKPVGEARSDTWIYRELCSHMDIDPSKVYPVDNKVAWFDTYVNMQYLEKDGTTWKNCFTFTAEDAKKYGVDNEPREGKMTFEEFIAQGSISVERGEDDYGFIAYEDYVNDPKASPLPSKSGKFELYCQLKADNYNIMGINPDPIKPYANYIVPVQGYEESFSDWTNKVKGEYPIQAYNVHYLRRAHTCYDNMVWGQEAFVNPVFLNASDAGERKISDGDTVLIRSAYGKTLRRAQLLESIMPGTLAIPHGAHSVLDESDPDDIIDRGGNEEILYGPIQSNYYPHLNGYNTLLVEYEKYDGDPIPEDYDRDPFLLSTEG